MNFENLAKTWEAFGKNDPLWAILAWDGKENNKWDIDEFLEVGEIELRHILDDVERRSGLSGKNRCLDFGCGVGRLTFPLGRHFNESHGVDISESMITKAQEVGVRKGVDNCIFHLNRRDDLAIFEDGYFDFILSIIVLQHMEPQIALSYLSELVRTLRKGGLLVFQLPDEIVAKAPYDEFKRDTEPVMEMYGMSKDEVVSHLNEQQASVLHTYEDKACGENVKSYRYFVSK